jgi:hypothetical protein
MKKYIVLLLTCLATLPSFAHPGHGDSDGYTITHYMVEPVHAFAVLASLAVIVLLVRRFRTSNAK